MLLATKLHVPGPQPGFVPRLRLAARLDEGLERGLVLVCAPAGSGKTALLSSWARGGQRPAAWLSLDASDNDPARFWRHTVAALDRARPGIAELLGRLIGAQRKDQDVARCVSLGCLARLQRAFGAGHAPPDAGPGAVAAPGIVEPLTARELEVLGLLAAGRSNQVIAGELVVTLDTVKKHVGHVLSKLGAASRTEAVARARDLGLLP